MIRVSREWKNPQVFSLAQGTGFNRDRSEEAQDPSWPLQPSKSRQTKAPRAMRAHRALLIVVTPASISSLSDRPGNPQDPCHRHQRGRRGRGLTVNVGVMDKQNTARWVWLLCAILAGVVLARIGLLVMSPQSHWLPAHGVIATRALAAAYLLCDVAISTSLITLLVMQDRRAPTWVERRFPSGGRWLWSLLLGLTILCYVSLAPTFLFFLVHLKK